jgi:hypothetical protein
MSPFNFKTVAELYEAPDDPIWDAATRRLDLGSTINEAARRGADETASRIEDAIVLYVAQHENVTRDSILAGVTGKSAVKSRALRALINRGTLGQFGAGTKGDPHTYRVEIPIEP